MHILLELQEVNSLSKEEVLNKIITLVRLLDNYCTYAFIVSGEVWETLIKDRPIFKEQGYYGLIVPLFPGHYNSIHIYKEDEE